MFSFHTENTAYASYFSVQRDPWKRERGEKNDLKWNMLKKEELVQGCVVTLFWFDVLLCFLCVYFVLFSIWYIFSHVVAFISVDIYNYPLDGQGKLPWIKTTDAVIYTL